jgi:enterobactin synthetase component D / holo-[acyl-carrier protein] synthase
MVGCAPWSNAMFDDALPADFAVEWGDPREPSLPLFPEELRLVASAVDKRRLEFARGRQCARAALRRLGLSDSPLLSGAQREPLWPAGVVGSITHTQGLCLAAVAWQSSYAGVGIDVEPALALEPALAQRIASEREMSALAAMPPLLAARLVFSAKEAFYKCQFYRTRQFLDFFDVSIELEPEGEFSARLLVEAGPLASGGCFRGSWRERDGFFFASIYLPAAPGPSGAGVEGARKR